MKRIKITHIITSLLLGGAEKVLLRLIREMNSDEFEHEVLALTVLGSVGDEFIEAGIPVKAVGFDKGAFNAGAVVRLCKELRRSNPDIVQTWLYHGDLIGGVTAKVCTSAPILWNLRQSNLDAEHSTKSTVVLANVSAKLSKWVPDTIICGSQAARTVHTGLGYDASKMALVCNGFDINKFKPSPHLRAPFRERHGLGSDDIVIGHAGRFDPQKDHKSMLEAAAVVAGQIPNAKFVFCGTKVTPDNDVLAGWVEDNGLQDKVLLLGPLDDMVEFYAGLDMYVMSSAYGEGGANVLGEAMSQGVPCIATDVGDCALILGETGPLVSPRHVAGLADAMVQLAKETPDQRAGRGERSRAHIAEHFPLAKMVAEYEDLYRQTHRA